LHISTQLGVVNFETARVLHEMGAKRVVLARELSLDEIRTIREKTPSTLELEAFVHGAMCMSVSGRCVISNYMTGRDANHGECTQPCRWKYDVVETHRPDKPMTVIEDEDGAYLFNAHDMNMIEHIADLAQSGVASLKIEGRAKSAYYTAVTANAYRRAVDGYVVSGYSSEYKPESWIVEELNKISHRPYGTGFYYGKPSQYLKAGGYIRSYEVAAVVEDWQDGWLKLSQRNRFFVGDTLDVLEPGGKPFDFTVPHMENDDRLPIESAPHPTMTVWIPCKKPLKKGTLFRFDKENGK
jgi:putative protease